MGVVQREIGDAEDSLLITQTMPRSRRAQMADLRQVMENEKQKLMDTNEIGFYVNSRMGLTFNVEILTELLEQTRKFKNAVMIVYDTQKSDYGLNPLHAFRLSEKAIATFTTRSDLISAHLVQEKINEKKLAVSDLFEEVLIKIQRSHMQQAYLFDHIQPQMPAFNTNLFKLSNPDYLCTHVHQALEVTEGLTNNQAGRQENLMKAY
jgi:hypothetical protein